MILCPDVLLALGLFKFSLVDLTNSFAFGVTMEVFMVVVLKSGKLVKSSSIFGFKTSLSFLLRLLNDDLLTPFEVLKVTLSVKLFVKFTDLLCCFSFLEIFSNFKNGFS